MGCDMEYFCGGEMRVVLLIFLMFELCWVGVLVGLGIG